ncbi:hypothetical protein J6590_076204 [Homalodisca vitripennis]|nr:hypothetical protein J6590_076204 [Homalodisca vitripennis]
MSGEITGIAGKQGITEVVIRGGSSHSPRKQSFELGLEVRGRPATGQSVKFQGRLNVIRVRVVRSVVKLKLNIPRQSTARCRGFVRDVRK